MENKFDPFSNKPDISPTSRKLYLFNLTKLNNGKEIKNLNFLSKKEIITKLEGLTPNTRRTYIIAIVSSLKDRPEPKYKKMYNQYYSLLTQINADLKSNTTKSANQEENWISQEDVEKICEDLVEKALKFKGEKKIDEKEYQTLLDSVILGLYCLQQPRRNKDYIDMFIVKKMPDNKDHNYLDITNWEWIFNNYKTNSTYKQVVIDVPAVLVELIKVYLQFHPLKAEIKKGNSSTPFLVDYNSKPLTTSTDMTRALNRILGGKVGSSMLRNIFLTDKYSSVQAELAKDVKAMGTSVETATNNYIKV